MKVENIRFKCLVEWAVLVLCIIVWIDDLALFGRIGCICMHSLLSVNLWTVILKKGWVDTTYNKYWATFVGLGWLAYYLKIVTLQPDDKQLVVAVFVAYFVVTGMKIVDLELDIFD